MTNSIVNVDDILDKKVMNLQGEELGKIETLMLDKVEGFVSYVVLSFGGFLGMGDKLFAMPWSIFTYDDDKECFVIAMDKEMLKNSPGFDKDQWPDMSNPSWGASIHQYYGALPHRASH